LNSGTIRVRPAIPADGEVWLSLIDALADYEQLPRPDASARQRLLSEVFGERLHLQVFLAESSNRIIGYAMTFETYSSFLAMPTLYLEDLFVLKDYRGQGAGFQLFRHCVQEAHRRGCGRMEWQVLDWNRPAIDFYERIGARQLKEWLPYRLLRKDMEALLGFEHAELSGKEKDDT
jgi:GNAT superfamily N-acetyltransferase